MAIFMKPISLIGAASGWGAKIRACEEGPVALLEKGLSEQLRRAGISVQSERVIFPKRKASDCEIPLEDVFSIICDFTRDLGACVKEAMERDEFPLVLGGDHSIAVGMWNGVKEALLKETHLPLGLLWIDAHMDAHTPETTPSGAWHGMPLAALLGYGKMPWKALFRKDPVLLPQNICLVGVRSFEEGEQQLLQKLNVRMYDMAAISKRGINAILDEAIAHVTKGTGGFGISLDLDVIDPSEAPGVGSPENGGLSANALVHALQVLKGNSFLKALEIVEYNPKRDCNDRTLHLVPALIKSILE